MNGTIAGRTGARRRPSQIGCSHAFDYKAVSTEGRMIHGRLDAINLIDLEMRLKRMELDLVTGTLYKIEIYLVIALFLAQS